MTVSLEIGRTSLPDAALMVAWVLRRQNTHKTSVTPNFNRGHVFGRRNNLSSLQHGLGVTSRLDIVSTGDMSTRPQNVAVVVRHGRPHACLWQLQNLSDWRVKSAVPARPT
jgi:hypothetical protein